VIPNGIQLQSIRIKAHGDLQDFSCSAAGRFAMGIELSDSKAVPSQKQQGVQK
jgi:hypothetical protein